MYSFSADKSLFLNSTDTKTHTQKNYVISIYAFRWKYNIQNNVTNTS
jgi:hypothetical protein